jgi:hypothetical protein
MKNIDKDIEILSAYIDDELSPEEVRILEEKISISPQLQKKLAKLKRLKELTTSSVKKLPESPYFETKLLAVLEGSSLKRKIKKWLPVTGIVVFTLSLMLILKFNPRFLENMVEEQKTNLAGFYKENLKPLLFAADLNNEDIFNFAFYNKLPLDNTKKQYLQLGSDSSGKEYFEIRTAGNENNDDNFQKFVQTLDMNDSQKSKFDSIMSGYAEQLQSQVLVNNKNTVAINHNLWNYRKAIAADILNFAKLSNVKAVNEVMPALFKFETPDVEKMVSSVKSADDNEYIFVTPESLFVGTFEFNKKEFQKDMDKFREGMQRSMEDFRNNRAEMQEAGVKLKLDSTIAMLRKVPKTGKNINIFVDSNLCRVHLNNIFIPKIKLPDMDSLEGMINEATKQVRAFSFMIPKLDKNISKFKYDVKVFPGDTVRSFKFYGNGPDADSLGRLYMKQFKNNNWSFPFNQDSLVEWFNQNFQGDSAFFGSPMNLEKRMKGFEKEMEKFKHEMDNLKKELKKDSVQGKPKKSVEV